MDKSVDEYQRLSVNQCMKNRPYKIIMSRGDSISIDAFEIEKVLDAVSSGSPAMLKSGIFNPSFFVSIVLDEDRMSSFYDELRYFDNQEDSRRQELLAAGPSPLKDMFEDIRKVVDSKRMLSYKDHALALEESSREQRSQQ